MLRGITTTIILFALFFCVNILVFSLSTEYLLYEETYELAIEQTDGYDVLLDTLGYEEVPGEVIEPHLNKVLSDSLGYFRGEKDQFDGVIPVEQMITDLTLAKVEELPICSDTQQAMVDGDLVCKPQGVDDEIFTNEILRGQNIPSDLSLLDVIGTENIESVRAITQHYPLLIYGSLTMIIVLLGILLFWHRHRLFNLAHWLEPELFLTGTTLIITSIVLQKSIPRIAGGFSATLLMIFSGMLSTLKIYGAILVAIGISLYVVVFYSKWKYVIKQENELVVEEPVH